MAPFRGDGVGVPTAHTNYHVAVYAASPDVVSSVTPSQMRHAYGIDQVLFGTIQGDGTGQTIALIDAYDYPTALTDLQHFDAQYGLPDPPSFRRVAQDGSTNYPATDPAGAGNNTWELEEALDIEWAHSIAPAANLILVEASSSAYSNLIQGAVNWARSQPGVSAISMSFGGGEFSGETAYDGYLTTPPNHSGVTFLASTGDSGQPGQWPAYSPNVVAIGGTTLSLSGSDYGGETGWGGSGGGISTLEAQPTYQIGLTPSSTMRSNPDVAMDANPASGALVYDSYDYPGSGWIQVGGTSLAAPMWAGLIAIANQGRALAGLPSLDGPSQTLPTLYSLPATDFHDVTSGSNGFQAGPGYDLVTGLGTPVANLLVGDLAGVGSISGGMFVDANGNGVRDPGEAPIAGAQVFLDSNNDGIYEAASSASFVSTSNPKSIPDNNSAGVTATVAVSGVASAISHLTVTFSITHPRDSDLTAYLIAPDGTTVTLFSGLSGVNFTSTTLDDLASMSIASGTSPYTGTFKPSGGTLATFDGKSANGTWGLKVVDSRHSNTGSITAFSLTFSTAGDVNTTTDANGNYGFVLPMGTYNVRYVMSPAYVPTTPTANAGSTVLNLASPNVTAQTFPLFPTVFSAAASAAAYYVSLDPTRTYLQISTAAAPQATPAYQITLTQLPALTFNLQGSAQAVYVDFSNGSPLPAGGGIVVNGAAGAGDELHIIGSLSAPPLTMTDTQIGPSGGPALTFQNVSTLELLGCSVSYTGFLSNLDTLLIGPGTTFYWIFA